MPDAGPALQIAMQAACQFALVKKALISGVVPHMAGGQNCLTGNMFPVG